MFFSFIMPAYNVEKTIIPCLDSITYRKEKDYEIIIVNDGSVDSTRQIIEEYAQRHENIMLIDKENGGMASARAEGLKYATGEYLFFCDSDDMYDSKALDSFCEKIKQTMPSPENLICFSFKNMWPTAIEETSRYLETDNFQIDSIEYASSAISHKASGFAVWSKLYSRKIIEDNKIRPISKKELGNKDDWAEDLVFTLQYYLCINKIKVYGEPIYLLRKHGLPEEQNENGLIGRIQHMMNIMSYLYNIDAPFAQRNNYKEDFFKILIWHMKRYFYLDAGRYGVERLRAECLQCKEWPLMKDSIEKSFDEKHFFSKRWNLVDAADYKALLQYLINGNIFLYKLKNIWIWKIMNKFGRKNERV